MNPEPIPDLDILKRKLIIVSREPTTACGWEIAHATAWEKNGENREPGGMKKYLLARQYIFYMDA